MAYASTVHIALLERAESVPRRVFHDREDAFHALSEGQFIENFRLSKEVFILLVEAIKNELPDGGLPVQVRVLTALTFYGRGSYQKDVANSRYLAISQKTVSRSIDCVSRAIVKQLMPQEIRFPSIQEQDAIKHRIYENTDFPGIIGFIDGTFVNIICPSEDSVRIRPNSYVNRKGDFAINVLMVIDDSLLIRAINAKYPGSVHDSFVWCYSKVKATLEAQYVAGHRNFWLLGDSGFPLEPWLMTPVRDPEPGTPEFRFNASHTSQRSAIERCNGVLKSRFRCLSKHRVLTYEPTPAGMIINACATLHNMCILQNVPVPEAFDDSSDSEDEIDDQAAINSTSRSNSLKVGKNIRDKLIARFR